MSRRHFLGRKEIARSSEEFMEREVKAILKGYARRWRELERDKRFGTRVTEAAYGERMTYKQLLNEYVGKGRLKYREAYRRLREEDIELTKFTKRELTGNKTLVEKRISDKHDNMYGYSLEQGLEVVRRENYLMNNYKAELDDYGITEKMDLSDAVSVYADELELSLSELGRRAHDEFETQGDYRIWVLKEIQKIFEKKYGV